MPPGVTTDKLRRACDEGGRRLALADGHTFRAAAVDLATGRGVGSLGRLTVDGAGQRGAAFQPRHARERRTGVGVRGQAQDRSGGAGLHDTASVHHRDAVGDMRNDAEVLSDERHGQATGMLQLSRHRQQPGLEAGIERGCRLVGDPDIGFGRVPRPRKLDARSSGTMQEKLRSKITTGGETRLDSRGRSTMREAEDRRPSPQVDGLRPVRARVGHHAIPHLTQHGNG